jgi:thymidylate kinase
MKTIVLEGIPGTGKTTLSKDLAASIGLLYYSEHIFINEMFEYNTRYTLDSESIYLLHWEVKWRLSRLIKKTCIFDRNHLSTLAYNYAKSKMEKNENYFSKVLSWYRERRRINSLKEPDCYFILDVDPSISLSRQPQSRNRIWRTEDGLNYSRDFYSSFENLLDIGKDVEVTRLTATEPIAMIKERLYSRINEII